MKKICEILNLDWFEIIADKWKEIPSVYKKSFLIIFIGINIAFAFHTFSFFHGYLDWGRSMKGININEALFAGRFSMHYVDWVLKGNNILPILGNMYLFLIVSLSAIFLCIYWKVPKNLFAFSAIGLLLAIQPYLLANMWYNSSIIGVISTILLIIIAFILCGKVSSEQQRIKKISFIIIALMLFILALGAYPSVINTMAIVFIGRIIIDIFLEWDGLFNGLKSILNRHKWTAITAGMSGACLKIIHVWLSYMGWLQFSYHTDTIALKDFIPHAIKVIDTAFATFSYYNFPFFPTYLIKLFVIVFCCAAAISILNIFIDARSKQSAKMLICQKITKALAFCFLTIMLIILSKSAAFIAKSLIPLTSAHTLFFGDAFLHIFPIALIFIQRFHLPKNLMVIVCLVLINICLIQDALALKIWKFGFEAEKMLLNRIMMRIEENPKFSNNKRYEIITIGSFPSYRPYYYEKTNEKIGSSSLLQGGYNRAWIVFFPEFKFGNSFGISGTLYRSLIKKIPGTFSQKAIDAVDRRYASALELVKYMREEIDNAQVWPSKNSIFVKDGIKDDMGIVIIILNERELDNIKQFIKKNGL